MRHWDNRTRWLVGVLTLLMLVNPVLALPEKMGDFDDDDKASILDVVRLINHVSQADPLPLDLAPYADVNQDGYVDQDDVRGLVDRVLERLPLDALPLTFLRNASPSPGEGGVAVTRETILRFSIQLAEDHGLNADTLYAEFGGKRLATRINVSPNRKTVTLFYDDPLPANSRIRVTLKGDQVVDYQGRKIDGDGDGEEGGDLVFDFDTLGLTVLEGTIVCGRVFASELEPALAAQADVNRPLEGATITVDGMEDEIFAITDEFGNFRLDPAPVGRFFVHIDGRTATINIPEGSYYPFVGKAWQSIPGQEINIGDIYLPLVKEGTLQNVSNTEDRTIGLPETVVNEFPEFADVAITVPAGSLFSDNGTRGGQVGLAPVDPDRIPGTLPPELNFPLVITVQTDGATNFDEPAPVCFPNLPDPDTGVLLGPGEKSALWSFNHDTGRFEIVGSMTVSGDGKMVCSDPGVGILAPGWHATQAGAVASGGDIVTNTPGPATNYGPATSSDSRPPASPSQTQYCPTKLPTRSGNPNTAPIQFSDAFGQSAVTMTPKSTSGSGPASKAQMNLKGNVGTDPVNYFSGEFVLSVLDLKIKGRGMDFLWTRKYRSQSGPKTTQGNGWDFSYNLMLIPDESDVIVCDGNSRADRFKLSGPNTWSREEYFRQLKKSEDGSYIMEFEDRGKWIYNALDAPSGAGRISVIEDRNGNRMKFFYDFQDRLIRVNDTLDRDINIDYNDEGFISTVTDFTGRTVSYDYYDGIESGGNFGDLKSCTSPAVTGTPNGNDFPNGKTTAYTYSTGFADERLNHNLLTITDGRRKDPNDPTFGEGPYIVNSYAATQDPNSFNFDRVVRQVWGGDIIDLVYEQLAPSGSAAAVTKAIINDRNGNVEEYFYDNRNRLVVLREFTGRADPRRPSNSFTNRPQNKLRTTDPEFFETRYSWNDDSLITEIRHPNGNQTQYVYESDLNPKAPIRNRGNLRISRQVPGTHLPAGDQKFIEEFFEYDGNFGCGNCGYNFVTKHTDGRGNVTRMTYDEHGNLVQTIHRIPSIVEEFEYNEHGQMTARVLPDNGSNYRRKDTFTYYESGPQRGYKKEEIIDADNLALTKTFTYDLVGNTKSVTSPKGHDSQLIYNQLDQVVCFISREVIDGLGLRYEQDYYYDANNNLVRLDIQNVGGNGAIDTNTHFTATWEFDMLNFPLRRTNEVDETQFVVTELSYDGNRNLTTIRKGEAVNGNQPDNVISLEWDERDLPFLEIRAPGTSEQSTLRRDYDGNQNLVRTQQGIEEQPRIHTYIYDGYDRRVGDIDPMGNSATITYDENHNAVSYRLEGELEDLPGMENNVRLSETMVSFDAFDRITATQAAFFNPASGQPIGDGFSNNTVTYTGLSDTASVIDDNGHVKSLTYDTVGRPSSIIDSKGNSLTFNYDLNSNVKTVLAIEKHDLADSDQAFTTTFAHDNLDRRISITNNVDSTATITYDSRGNPVEVSDALENVVRHTYDGLNRKTSTKRILTDNGLGSGNEVSQITVHLVWDDSHRLIQRIDSNGNATTTTFDALDRLSRISYADGTHRSLQYDVHNNNLFESDPNGNEIITTYDLLNRVVGRSITPGPEVSAETTEESYDYDGLSRLVRARDDDSEVLRLFDSLANLVSETLNGQTTSATFDGVGNLLSRTYPGGRVIEYEYDELNRKSVLNQVNENLTNSLIGRFYYVGPGRMVRREYGNGTQTDIEYDGISGVQNPIGDFGERQIISMRHSRDADEFNLAHLEFRWDRMGNKLSHARLNDSPEKRFQYDSAYRMIESITNGDTISYTIDKANNRTEVDGGAKPGTYSLDTTTPMPADFQMNQYSSTPEGIRIHDNNGNVVSSGADREFTYNYANQLVGYDDQEVSATYRYDPLGRRISKTVGQETINFFYGDYARVIEEQNNNGETTATYVFGNHIDDVVEMNRGGESFYLHTDDQFSTVAVSDSSGALAESMNYGDFGEPMANFNVGNPWLFNGRYFDSESGLYNYRTRYLDPVAGRFLTRDNLGIWGDPGNFGNPYTYVGNSPYSRMDPFGLEATTTAVLAGILAVPTVGLWATAQIGTTWDAWRGYPESRLPSEILKGPCGKDLQEIQRVFTEVVKGLNEREERIPGSSGEMAGWYNNLWVSLGDAAEGITGNRFGTPSKGCGEQVVDTSVALGKAQLKNNWTFKEEEEDGYFFDHQYGVASSGNPDCPKLLYDPWKNELTILVPRQSGREGGNSGVSFDRGSTSGSFGGGQSSGNGGGGKSF